MSKSIAVSFKVLAQDAEGYAEAFKARVAGVMATLASEGHRLYDATVSEEHAMFSDVARELARREGFPPGNAAATPGAGSVSAGSGSGGGAAVCPGCGVPDGEYHVEGCQYDMNTTLGGGAKNSTSGNAPDAAGSGTVGSGSAAEGIKSGVSSVDVQNLNKAGAP